MPGCGCDSCRDQEISGAAQRRDGLPSRPRSWHQAITPLCCTTLAVPPCAQTANLSPSRTARPHLLPACLQDAAYYESLRADQEKAEAAERQRREEEEAAAAAAAAAEAEARQKAEAAER